MDARNSGNCNDEYLFFSVAMKAMNKVASHINEMQKLHEEYGAVFDQLINEQTAVKKEVNVMITITFINCQSIEYPVT